MAKQSGLGDQLYVGGYNFSGDIGSLSRIGGGPAPLEFTGIDKSAFERRGGTLTGGIDFTAFFNPAVGAAHDVLSALPTADQIVSYYRGQTLGNAAASMVAKQVNYDPTRGQDGSLTLGISTLSTAGYPLEWGKMVTPGSVNITGAASGTGVDTGAGSSFGMSAYLHVFAFTGTDATVLVQGSSDNGVGDAFSEPGGGFAFTQITTAPFTQRIATGNLTAIERYVRQAVVTTGGFTSLTYAVMVVRNETAVAF